LATADLAAWERNLLHVDSAEWQAMEPLIVAVDGEPVWGALSTE
jgi:hypothetical protein